MTSYNANDCVIEWGDTTITGLGEDMVTGEKDEEMFSTSVGAKGDVVMNEVNNTLGTVTLTIQATSPERDLLYDDARTGAVKSLTIKNVNLGEEFGGTQARIKNFPSVERGQEASDLEFEFQVFDYDVKKTA